MKKQRIVIVGGGFAGVKCAKTLSKRLPNAELILFNKDNYMLFQPLLADVAGSSLASSSITAPLRQVLPKVDCRTEEVVAIEPESRRLTFTNYAGKQEELDFDHLVLAVGNRVDLSRVPGMMNHAMPLKSIGDAIALRLKVMERLEQANAEADPEKKKGLLSFIVIGGGFSGVEVAGEINDLARHAAKYYPKVDAHDICVTLVHSRDQILPEVSPSLRDFALQKMQKAHIRFVLNSRAKAVTERKVYLEDGAAVAGATIVCTVGNAPSALITGLDLPKDRGRLRTAADMRVEGTENLWAVGDCAAVPNEHDGQVSPATAQFAERQGRQAAENIVRVFRGQATQPFAFKPVGLAAGIGDGKGVAELFGVRLSGFPAFWLWRSAFLVKLPSMLQKLKVGLNWAWEMIFPREIAAFSAASTPPVSRAFFARDEFVLDPDTQSDAFYAIEHGEAVLEEMQPDGTYKSLCTFGRGDLIGPHSLEGYTESPTRLRASNALEAVVLPHDILGRISAVLKPMETLLERAAAPPMRSWSHGAVASSALSKVACEDIMRTQVVWFDQSLSAAEAFEYLCSERLDFGLIGNDEKPIGIVTRTDVIAGLEDNANATVADLMTKEPLVACAEKPCNLPAQTMRTHGLKFMPVVDSRQEGKVTGSVYAEDLMLYLLAQKA